MREKHRNVITREFGRAAANGLQVLERLYSLPMMNVSEIAELTNVSFSAANMLTNRLVEHAILQEVSGQARNRVFRYGEYANLFAQND